MAVRDLETLYDYGNWANERLMRVISQITPDEFARPTRIAFQVRMSFAQVTPRQRWLDGHFVLARRIEHPRFRKIETFSPRNHVHHFRLLAVRDVDTELRAWLKEAYAVGQQHHLRSGRKMSLERRDGRQGGGAAGDRA